MSKAQPKNGTRSPITRYDDGVVVHGSHTSRWQKYGKDRIYPCSAEEGYLDIEKGEVVDLKPRYESGVKEYSLEFDADADEMVFKNVGRPDVVNNSLSGKDEKTIARIPRSVMGWGDD